MPWTTLDDLDLSGKVVLTRVDINVPMEGDRVTDTTRIDKIVPTVQDIQAKGGIPVLMAHFDRPKGKRVDMHSTTDAIANGIETIYQDLALCENLDATINIFLGREPMRKFLGVFNQVDRRKMNDESLKVLDRLDIVIPNLQRPIKQMSGGQRQRIGLARAIYDMPALVVLDEPNSNLDSDGEAALLNAISALKEAKRTVIVVTHKTNILAVADKIVLMAGGRAQGFGPRDAILSKLVAPANAAQIRRVATTS